MSRKTAIHQPEPAASGPVPALRITARTASFWRAGLNFGADPHVVPLHMLTPDQEAALRGERMLIVEDVTLDPPPPPEGTA